VKGRATFGMRRNQRKKSKERPERSTAEELTVGGLTFQSTRRIGYRGRRKEGRGRRNCSGMRGPGQEVGPHNKKEDANRPRLRLTMRVSIPKKMGGGVKRDADPGMSSEARKKGASLAKEVAQRAEKEKADRRRRNAPASGKHAREYLPKTDAFHRFQKANVKRYTGTPAPNRRIGDVEGRVGLADQQKMALNTIPADWVE